MGTDAIRDALACYRLTRAWITDTHDFPPTAQLRLELADALHGTKWEPLNTCPWCASMWAALAVLISRRVAPRAWGFVGSLLAASAVAGVISETLGEMKRLTDAVEDHRPRPASTLGR